MFGGRPLNRFCSAGRSLARLALGSFSLLCLGLWLWCVLRKWIGLIGCHFVTNPFVNNRRFRAFGCLGYACASRLRNIARRSPKARSTSWTPLHLTPKRLVHEVDKALGHKGSSLDNALAVPQASETAMAFDWGANMRLLEQR